MKRTLILAAACLVAALTQAAPIPSGQLQHRVTVRPYADLGLTLGSMYNPRFIDGYIYATEIGDTAHACFGRYASSSSTLLAGVIPATEHRMVTSFRGANSSAYMLACSGAYSTTFTRYDFDGNNPQTVDFVERVECFDWVDDDTIICNDYTSGNRRRVYLADVVAEPFAVTINTLWNANGYITSAATTRIRNVRVGETYPNYAYYGDNGVSVNPKVYALNLTTGVETEVGSWNGTLKAGIAGGAATDSWGLWTVVERGGYLYLHSSDDGIQVYAMTDATTMGSLYTYYPKTELDTVTGGTPAYYGFDVAPNGARLLLGGYTGNVSELQRQGAPYLPAQLQLSVTMQPFSVAGQNAGSMYNPRTFNGYNYCTSIGDTTFACDAWYPSGNSTPSAWFVPATEHRMFAPVPGGTYLLACSGAFSTTFTRYNIDGTNPQTVDFGERVECFDWVDDDTIICNDYTSGNRRRVYLADVVAEPFAVTLNTTWNANGYITSAATTRIRNVRVGDMYSGYAYYGDNGVSVNPKVYALNLATGVESEVGSWNGTLKAGIAGGAATDSWGLWTAVERGGYLYLHSSDDGIQIYNMTDATHMGSLHTAYSKAELDAVTTGTPAYYGFDVSQGGTKLLLGGYTGSVYEFGPPIMGITQSGTDVMLSWEASVTAVVVQFSSGLSPSSFSDIYPTVVVNGKWNTATITPGASPEFYRLRKSP
jgi:hypothetical protein